jgi:hypothetical protein
MLMSEVVPGATLMGLYLLVANALVGYQRQLVFSAQAIPDYKNLFRLHLTSDKLTIYPIGIRKVHRRWKPDHRARPTESPSGVTAKAWAFSIDREDARPWIEPEDDNAKPFLIEPPVEIGKR